MQRHSPSAREQEVLLFGLVMIDRVGSLVSWNERTGCWSTSAMDLEHGTLGAVKAVSCFFVCDGRGAVRQSRDVGFDG